MNATPVMQSAPILPNAMAWIVTAVPQCSGILLSLRYVFARGDNQLLNTAQVASRSCSSGFCGNDCLLSCITSSLYCSTSSARCVSSSSVSSVLLYFCLHSSSRVSNL